MKKVSYRKKYNLLYIGSLAVIIFLFQMAAQYLDVIKSPLAWVVLVVILLLFNQIWERICDEKKRRGKCDEQDSDCGE